MVGTGSLAPFIKGEALKVIAKMKKNGEGARLLVRVCCAIGMADGDFDESEKSMIRHADGAGDPKL